MTDPTPAHGTRPRMLFVRNFQKFTGGHLKWLHYLSHTLAHGRFQPLLHVTPNSKHDAFEPLLPSGIERCDLPMPGKPDALFIAGHDWDTLDRAGQETNTVPVVNFIQHVRHADPDNRLSAFLDRPATRICVSARVADAITATGRVNGPVHVIENGLDLSELSALRSTPRKRSVFIGGLKSPDLARDVAAELTQLNIPHHLQIDPLERGDYLARLAGSSHALLLPDPTEGFYLPALEAMAMGVTLIMPDCIGARGFAIDGETCCIAPRNAHALASAAAALLADPDRSARLSTAAHLKSAEHDIKTERNRYFDILDHLTL